MIGLAWLMSSHKRKFPWRVVIGGLILQFVFAGIMFASRNAAGELAGRASRASFDAMRRPPTPAVVNASLRWPSCAATARAAERSTTLQRADRLRRRRLEVRVRRHFRNVFAFRVLPSIIFFAALMQVLYYVGVMQQIVRGLGFVVQRTLGTTGAGEPGRGGQYLSRADRGAAGRAAVRQLDDQVAS